MSIVKYFSVDSIKFEIGNKEKVWILMIFYGKR